MKRLVLTIAILIGLAAPARARSRARMTPKYQPRRDRAVWSRERFRWRPGASAPRRAPDLGAVGG